MAADASPPLRRPRSGTLASAAILKSTTLTIQLIKNMKLNSTLASLAMAGLWLLTLPVSGLGRGAPMTISEL